MTDLEVNQGSTRGFGEDQQRRIDQLRDERWMKNLPPEMRKEIVSGRKAEIRYGSRHNARAAKRQQRDDRERLKQREEREATSE